MPTITRWFIKASLVYFVAALGVGAALAAGSVWDLPAVVGSLAPVYFHLFLLGWVTQLIIGMVIWMFPKYTRELPRGPEILLWLTFWLLNAGLVLRAVSEPLNSQQPGTAWGWLLALSALLQWVAGLLFVASAWPRVKER